MISKILYLIVLAIAPCHSQTLGEVFKNRLGTTDNYCLQILSAKYVVSTCFGYSNQLFTYTPQNQIERFFRTDCIQADQQSGIPIAAVCSNSLDQQWNWDSQERFRLISNSSLCLDLQQPSSMVNNNNVILNLCNDSPSQKWYKVICGPGFTKSPRHHFCYLCNTHSIWNGTHCTECPRNYYSSKGRNICLKYPTKHQEQSYGVITIAGGARFSTLPVRDGQGTRATFGRITFLTFDPSTNDIIIVDNSNAVGLSQFSNMIRRMNLTGFVTTIAGNASCLFSDGRGTEAAFCNPQTARIGPNTSIFVTDYNNDRIRVIDSTGSVRTFLGNLPPGTTDGPLSSARIGTPKDVLFEKNGDMLIGMNRLRRVNTTGHVSTLIPSITTGTLMLDSEGALYISDPWSFVIRRVNLTTMTVSIIAGDGVCGLTDGYPNNTQLCYSDSMAYCPKTGFIYIVDNHYHRIRRIGPDGFISTLPITSVSKSVAVAVDSDGNIYVDSSDFMLLKIVPCPYDSTWNTITASCECNPGFLYNSTFQTCNKCPMGTVKPAFGNNLNCQICPVGTQVTDQGVACQQCLAGSYRPSLEQNQCIPCPLGTFQNETGSLSCIPCPLGKESSSELTSCVTCKTGTFRGSMDNQTCLNCPLNSEDCNPLGFQCSPGFTLVGQQCSSCPLGEIKTTSGNHSCSKCPIGQQPNSNKTICVDCPEKTFKPSIDHVLCIECPNGAVCTSVNMTCQVGYAPHLSQPLACQQCIDGFFKSADGNYNCTQCPIATFSSDDYSTCLQCSAGSFLDSDGTCKRCGVGRQPTSDRMGCINCPANTYKPLDTINNCLKCPTGATCSTTGFECNGGYEINGNENGCQLCAIGFFKQKPGNTMKCSACPAGTQSSQNREQCQACPDNFYRSPNFPYPYCIPCPNYVSECKPTGFKCQIGYTYNIDMTLCVPKRVMVQGNITIVIIDDVTSSESAETRLGKDIRAEQLTWSNFFIQGIFYAYALPVFIVIIFMITGCMKYRVWRRKELKKFKGTSKVENDTLHTVTSSTERITSPDATTSRQEYAEDIIYHVSVNK